MSIEFHCEHCGKLIKSPVGNAGHTGRCPHCQGENYIPATEEGSGILPLAPLDEEFEQRRKKASAEDAAVQWRLLHDTSLPGEAKRRGSHRVPPTPSAPSSATNLTTKQLIPMIVSYLNAMSQGQLEDAQKLISQLKNYKREVNLVLEEMMSDDTAGYGLPSLPRPVLMGFVKQLRSNL